MGMKNSKNKIKQKRPLKKNLPEIDINLKQTKNMCLALWTQQSSYYKHQAI